MALDAYTFMGYFMYIHKYCLLLKSYTITLLMYVTAIRQWTLLTCVDTYHDAHTQYNDDKTMIKYHAWPTMHRTQNT